MIQMDQFFMWNFEVVLRPTSTGVFSLAEIMKEFDAQKSVGRNSSELLKLFCVCMQFSLSTTLKLNLQTSGETTLRKN